EHHRDPGDEERERGVAAHPAQVASEHRRRVGQGKRIRGNRTATLSFSGVPVSVRKTSSRSGVSTDSSPTSMELASSVSNKDRSEPTPPSLGIWSVSDSSSRVAPS